MDVEKARQFLTQKGWDKTNPTVGGVFFEGIAKLLAEYEAKVIAVQNDVSGNEALRVAVAFADWIHLHSYSKTTQGWIWARGEYPFPIQPDKIEKYSTNELYEKFKSETAKATDR